jgi:hypothetical protein
MRVLIVLPHTLLFSWIKTCGGFLRHTTLYCKWSVTRALPMTARISLTINPQGAFVSAICPTREKNVTWATGLELHACRCNTATILCTALSRHLNTVYGSTIYPRSYFIERKKHTGSKICAEQYLSGLFFKRVSWDTNHGPYSNCQLIWFG